MDNFDLDAILEFQAAKQDELNPPKGEDTPPITPPEQEQKNLEEEIDEDKIDEKNDNTKAPEIIDDANKEISEKNEEEPSNVLEAYYDFLKEQELIVVDDTFKFDGTEESLNAAKIETLAAYKNKAIAELESVLSDKFKEVLRYGLNGGKDPMDILVTTDPLDVDLSNKDKQIEIIRQHLKKTTNFNDDKIERQIKRFETSDELEQEAYDALDELKELREEEKELSLKQREIQQKELELQQKEFRDKITASITEYDDIAKERKSKVQAFMFNQIKKGTEILTDYERNLRSISSNPKHLVQLADILFDYDAQKGINLDRFKKQGETSANQSLRAKLESKFNSPKGTGSNSKQSHQIQHVDWESYLS